MRHVQDAELRRVYRQRRFKLLRTRRAASLVMSDAIKCAMHYHAYTMRGRWRPG
jgi:hypothetical protein